MTDIHRRSCLRAVVQGWHGGCPPALNPRASERLLQASHLVLATGLWGVIIDHNNGTASPTLRRCTKLLLGAHLLALTAALFADLCGALPLDLLGGLKLAAALSSCAAAFAARRWGRTGDKADHPSWDRRDELRGVRVSEAIRAFRREQDVQSVCDIAASTCTRLFEADECEIYECKNETRACGEAGYTLISAHPPVFAVEEDDGGVSEEPPPFHAIPGYALIGEGPRHSSMLIRETVLRLFTASHAHLLDDSIHDDGRVPPRVGKYMRERGATSALVLAIQSASIDRALALILIRTSPAHRRPWTQDSVSLLESIGSHST